MLIYSSAALYIETATSLCDRLVKVEAVIDALLLKAAEATDTDTVSEYWLDDGQVKIKTVFAGSGAIFKSIQNYQRLANLYRNKLNGRQFQLRDGKSFNNRNGYT